MQFHLEIAELNLLANVLLEQDPRPYQELMNKILARDLRLDGDELQQAADLLAAKKLRLKDEIARQPDASLKLNLEQQLALLHRVLERVNDVLKAVPATDAFVSLSLVVILSRGCPTSRAFRDVGFHRPINLGILSTTFRTLCDEWNSTAA
jgi:hypothetical protein